jgi:hypothetical protein
MRPSIFIPFLLGGALLCGGAAASPPPAVGQETWIPDVNRDGFIEWRAESRDTLYIRAMNGKWYLVRTEAPCPRMRSATALGFIASPTDRLDRFSTILAEGWRCQIGSVTLSDPPPPRPRRR